MRFYWMMTRMCFPSLSEKHGVGQMFYILEGLCPLQQLALAVISANRRQRSRVGKASPLNVEAATHERLLGGDSPQILRRTVDPKLWNRLLNF